MPFSPVPPHDSPVVAHQHLQRPDRPASSNPAPPPLSKRDKRRNVLSDKLTDLTNSFSQNRDNHYRSQLTALQVDMQMILRANPYKDAPLADSGEDIDEMIAQTIGGNPQAQSSAPDVVQSSHRWAEPDAAALAGRWYMQFVEDINSAAEERDLHLTQLELKHRRELEDFENLHRYKVRLAEEEHSILGRTIRERLVNSITDKKKRLTKEKEQLDVADSNALLLHPNQFSITNPASPGGAHSNRKTRNTRHRPGEPEEPTPSISAIESGNKRKRKLAQDEDIGSPAPNGGTSSPYRDARARLVAAQFEAPLFSIEKLFTEKELSMHLHMAATAATSFFNSDKVSANGTSSDPTAPPTLPLLANSDVLPSRDPSEPPLLAPEMDRAANTSHHATRSTRNTASGLAILGDLAVSEKNANANATVSNGLGGTGVILGTSNAGFAPVVLPNVINKTGAAPPPPVPMPEEVDEDLSLLGLLAADRGRVERSVLAEVLGEPIPPGVSMRSNGIGGVPMSAQSSVMGTDLLGFSAPEGWKAPRDEGGWENGSVNGKVLPGFLKRSAGGAGLVAAAAEQNKRSRNR
ncbi:MAG: hypothetical protein M1814_005433 [Vezdaea aestivalis]|nr:MAG: hypothetical protein M1814_005433 [Vezdaea aestivalis]